ncbi:MAG: class I SAM-dependent methyltransferase [Pseudomonadota bacterium]
MERASSETVTASSQDLKRILRDTASVYSKHAERWGEGRTLQAEEPWLQRLTEGLEPGATVLDLGCGNGIPIGPWLTSAGFSVVGFDYAEDMIRVAKDRVPQGTWHVGDMTALPPLGPCDAILSWDGFFHLTVAQQRKLLPELLELLTPHERMLLTIGDQEGEITGEVYGDTVYHASLAPDAYKSIIAAHGRKSELVIRDPQTAGRTILFVY